MKIRNRILVIGDNLTVCQSVKKSMQNDSTDVNYAMSVREILNALSSSEYSLVIICIQSDVKQDAEIVYLIRESSTLPIMAIIPKLSVQERVSLFHAGINACLDQFVDMTICVAQANSLIQLYLDAQKADCKEHPLVFGTELIINPIYRHVIIDGEHLELTRTEFDLLYCMAKHPNQIFSRQQLYSQVWNDDLGISGENTVRSHIGNLNKKLADMGRNYIQNSRGVGYKFVPPAGKE